MKRMTFQDMKTGVNEVLEGVERKKVNEVFNIIYDYLNGKQPKKSKRVDGFTNGHEEIKSKLIEFENNFAKTKTPEERLELVKKIADYVPTFGNIRIYKKRRMEADKKKYNIYNSPCIICGTLSNIISHHLIQLQNNGDNRRANVKPVCIRCHHLIHPWLKENILKNHY